jgi:hypothetical protein
MTFISIKVHITIVAHRNNIVVTNAIIPELKIFDDISPPPGWLKMPTRKNIIKNPVEKVKAPYPMYLLNFI